MSPVTTIHGNSPIVLAQPHSGTYVPDDAYAHLNDLGRSLIDTDWHIPQLYDGLLEDVTVVRANFSRYVIDANRDPQGKSLYPGKNVTELVPLSTFDGKSIWKTTPSSDDVADRLKAFHSPYHHAIKAELQRVKELHGIAVLYDCHSIRSEIPYLFDGELATFNVGSNDRTSCDQGITNAIQEVCALSSKDPSLNYSWVVNGRFKGGWTTRHYGMPKNGVHAVQMELAQRAYLLAEESPFAYDSHKAEKLRSVLRDILLEISNILQSNHLAEH